MSETQPNANPFEDGREFAATIFDVAAANASKLAAVLPDPAREALMIGAGLSNVIAAIIRSAGTDGARELIEELQSRKNEGRISPDDIKADNDTIANAVANLYREEDES
jgi:hypothetical protein